MTEFMELMAPDEPALIVTTGRGEAFFFRDSNDGATGPDVTGLAAAVLVTRLRWWADWIERKAGTPDILRGWTAAERGGENAGEGL